MRSFAAAAVMLAAWSAQANPTPYGEEVKSLRAKKGTIVRAAARSKAAAVGKIARGTRVAWTTVTDVSEKKCPRWVGVSDPSGLSGYVCEKDLEPSEEEPRGDEQPVLKAGELVPGKFGKIVAGEGTKAFRSVADVRAGKESRVLTGTLTVRRKGVVKVDGKRFWRTDEGELIPAEVVKAKGPSEFSGIDLTASDAPPLPFGWAQSPGATRADVRVRAEPKRNAEVVRKVEARTILPVLETSRDKKWIRVGEDEWVAARELRLVRETAPPELTLADERWIDVDLDQQVLVAYEGTKPVYATMASTGKKKWPTPPGHYRIMSKDATARMKSRDGAEDVYDVKAVPWTMTVQKYYALHGAYWHDRFGQKQSHGCINLSPKDARALYKWSAPFVPDGWSEVIADVDNPGTLVRVHSRWNPNPKWKGLAKEVFEARGGKLNRKGLSVTVKPE